MSRYRFTQYMWFVVVRDLWHGTLPEVMVTDDFGDAVVVDLQQIEHSLT